MVEKRKRTPEARRASAQKYADRCIRLGMMFHAAQQESFNGWAVLDEWADAQEKTSASQPIWEAEMATPADAAIDLGTFKINDLRLLILTFLRDEEMHGYQICRSVHERSRGQYGLQATVLYPLLYSLEKGGIIEGQWQLDPQGQERKYFRLTDRGMKVLGKKRNVKSLDDLFAYLRGRYRHA